MPSPKLDAILKDRTQGQFFMAYLKDIKMDDTIAFIKDKPKPPMIYDKYMSKSPKVKIAGIDSWRTAAQKAYIARIREAAADAAERGERLSKSDAHEVGCITPGVYRAFLDAQSKVESYLEKTAVRTYRTTIFYENYVGTQVDGSSLAAKLGYPPKAGQDLADAKKNLLLGKKGHAKTCAKMAIEKKMEDELKGKNRRHGVRFPKETDVLKELDKVKIKL